MSDIDFLKNEVKAKVLGPAKMLFVIPFKFIQHPFSFFRYVQTTHSLSHSVTIFFQYLLIELFIMVPMMNSILESNVKNGSTPDWSWMSTPIIAELLIVTKMLFWFLITIPLCRFLCKDVDKSVLRNVIVTAIFFNVFEKLFGIISNIPRLLNQHTILDLSYFIDGKFSFIPLFVDLFLLIAMVYNIKQLSNLFSYKRILVTVAIYVLVLKIVILFAVLNVIYAV